MDDADTQALRHRAALRRAAALLVALAALAERAALRSAPVIWLVLWVLRPAEAAARAFVVRSAWELGFGVEMLDAHEPMGAGPAAQQAALRLALTFRDLADVLEELAALDFDVSDFAAPRQRPAVQVGTVFLRRLAHILPVAAGFRPAYCDTS